MCKIAGFEKFKMENISGVERAGVLALMPFDRAD